MWTLEQQPACTELLREHLGLMEEQEVMDMFESVLLPHLERIVLELSPTAGVLARGIQVRWVILKLNNYF